jgi:hypothetical protein
MRYWQNEFWNRSVRRVYGLDGATLAGGMPQQAVRPDRATSVLRTPGGEALDADYVLTDTRAPLQGTRVATDPAHLLVLYRVRKPARLALRISGWYDDTWTSDHVIWQRSVCDGGRLRFNLRSDPGLFKGVVQRITVAGTTPAQTLRLRPTDQKVVTVPLRPRGDICTVDLRIAPARVPARYPRLHVNDDRLLGAHVDYFTYLPPR